MIQAIGSIPAPFSHNYILSVRFLAASIRLVINVKPPPITAPIINAIIKVKNAAAPFITMRIIFVDKAALNKW
ncbi:MAG: hypothetical protein HC831_11180 [Chloroflexia bacterium]|nr:hypothetical protein [Chloroflexia bacterium]